MTLRTCLVFVVRKSRALKKFLLRVDMERRDQSGIKKFLNVAVDRREIFFFIDLSHLWGAPGPVLHKEFQQVMAILCAAQPHLFHEMIDCAVVLHKKREYTRVHYASRLAFLSNHQKDAKI